MPFVQLALESKDWMKVVQFEAVSPSQALYAAYGMWLQWRAEPLIDKLPSRLVAHLDRGTDGKRAWYFVGFTPLPPPHGPTEYERVIRFALKLAINNLFPRLKLAQEGRI